MQKEFIKQLIMSVYSNEDNIIFKGLNYNDLGEEDIAILNGFHLKEVCLIEMEDDYLCGIRANHFCIEYGEHEHLDFAEHQESFDIDSINLGKFILITANHKGVRTMTLLQIPF